MEREEMKADGVDPFDSIIEKIAAYLAPCREALDCLLAYYIYRIND